jgi:hypothetical protein
VIVVKPKRTIVVNGEQLTIRQAIIRANNAKRATAKESTAEKSHMNKEQLLQKISGMLDDAARIFMFGTIEVEIR